MKDKKLSFDMKVTCKDGTDLEGVEYWIEDDALIYKSSEGVVLTGEKKPVSFHSGKSEYTHIEVMRDVRKIRGKS